MSAKRKLIEVALPLEAINQGSIREKNIRQSNPATLHLWWARRPLAACRAVLFASLVDDPSSHPERFPTEEAQEKERHRLFKIIEELVTWENSNDERVLEAARIEIRLSTKDAPPPVLDPFCGGGSIPLEAQRLGLEACGSDLNPVAVLITKALTELPPKFSERPPVNPAERQGVLQHSWQGISGLAEDVRYYGRWLREQAESLIGHLYPKVRLLKGQGGGEATVIAWLWTRTVKCPNPACGAWMPLLRSYWVATKEGRKTWLEPVVERSTKSVQFEVRTKGNPPEGTVNRRGAKCIVCGLPVPFDHIRAEGRAGRIRLRLMAIAAEGKGGRVYVPPSAEHQSIALGAKAKDVLDTALPEQALGFRVQTYGVTRHCDLFTSRQLVALTTFTDLIGELRKKVRSDAKSAGVGDDGKGLEDGGSGATAYADAVSTYLGIVIDNLADLNNAFCRWKLDRECPVQLFARQAIPMVWDFPEANPFSESAGGILSQITNMARRLESLHVPRHVLAATVRQHDATSAFSQIQETLVCTDPPYYDNIGYADLSDFFYVWLRRSLGEVWPKLFSTILVPKSQELIASPHRFKGGKEEAREFFEKGLGRAFSRMRTAHHPDYPLTVFYAFKQAEDDEDDDTDSNDGKSAVASTGWETMLKGLFDAGFSVTGTWPMRTEMASRSVGQGTNALASSIVLVCRLRPESASVITRRDFTAALKKELPGALKKLQEGNIAPVDLAQASIGPGMAVFSQYAKVLEADGSPMPVRTALQVINQELDAFLAAQEGEMDRDTRFCLAWFEQYGIKEGPFGEADVLARAKDTSVQGLVEAGVIHAKAGKVRILASKDLDPDWSAERDTRLTVWECAQHLIRRLEGGGEVSAAGLFARLGGSIAESARDLAYRLYSICERKGWAEEARAYNNLIVSWPSIRDQAATEATRPKEGRLF